MAPIKALNAYFQMPFSSAAQITLTNEGKVRTDNLYFAVDYVTLPALPADLGRFHAQYRQAAPCKGWTDNWSNNWDDPVGDKQEPRWHGQLCLSGSDGAAVILWV